MVKKRPESPWLARELDHFYQNDLYDVLRSPTQETSFQEDVIREAKTELKRHDSAIKKHLVKKAALEEKSKPWELDSAVSSNIIDSDEATVDPFRTEPAIEKRIRELEEASKQQDLAIQKHNTKKAALKRGIELGQQNLGYEPAQKRVPKSHPRSSMQKPIVMQRFSQASDETNDYLSYSITSRRTVSTSSDCRYHSTLLKRSQAHKSIMDEMSQTFERVDING